MGRKVDPDADTGLGWPRPSLVETHGFHSGFKTLGGILGQ